MWWNKKPQTRHINLKSDLTSQRANVQILMAHKFPIEAFIAAIVHYAEDKKTELESIMENETHDGECAEGCKVVKSEPFEQIVKTILLLKFVQQKLIDDNPGMETVIGNAYMKHVEEFSK